MRSAEDLPPPVGALAAAASSTASRPRVVIVGAGFGGLSAARRLAGTPADVLLIDRSNYHLFTPLLYQVATAGIEAEEIVQPVRAILRGRRGVHFRVAEVNGVDLHRRQVRTSVGRVAYDYLILAAGSTNNFFGDAALERAALGLKDVEEALLLRNHILRQVERAAWEPRAVRRRELLSFVVVGGGPTGVEFAGALS
ncbi:MAG TPA: FAD-dependent oxidoreductase, partial [Dehalococcoidia bacterium]|nr:FAD-dependent oxidoreductase [Dehalococcoidia bacterium]